MMLIPVLWVSLFVPSYAEDIKVDANKIVRLKADLTSPQDIPIWSVTPEDSVDAEELDGGRFYFTAPPGVYRVKCVVVPVKEGKISGRVITTRYVVTIGTPGPTPPNPPGPNPPVPPTPSTAPINGKGLHVLVLIETADAPKLPPAQYNAIYGQEFHDYLDSKTPIGPDGKQHEWWILDKDSDVSALPDKWKNAVKRAKESKDFKTPWIIVSNPDKGGGYEGPLPATKQEILNLLKKYGD
jgi:hypothetical protein